MNKQQIKDAEPDEAMLLKYVRGEASDIERDEIEGWQAVSADNESVLLQIASMYYQQRKIERIAARNTVIAFDAVQHRISTHTLKIWLRRASAVAACIVGAFILSFMILSKSNPSEVREVQIVKVQANAGMRTTFNLPDGTVAYLNSGSTLSYPLFFSSEERCVSLIGEAYFKVTHNPEQPFIVSISDDKMRVRALGTEFNVQAYETENNIETTLISGSVLLEARQNNEITQDTKLVPSEKAIYNLISGTFSVEKVNTECDTAWIDGRLMFKNQPLPQVLRDLSHFYNVKFEVRDSVINSYCFTGTFENKQLFQVLDYLKISSQIDYTIKKVASDDSSGVQYTIVTLKKNSVKGI